MVLKKNLNIRNSNGVGNENGIWIEEIQNWIQIRFDLWDLNMKFKWVLNYGILNIEFKRSLNIWTSIEFEYRNGNIEVQMEFKYKV